MVLAGRVLLVRGADSTPLAGRMVLAHAVGPARQGPFDSVRTDAAGRFRFRSVRTDSGTVYLVSTGYSGIGYFSEPYGGGTRQDAGEITLAVYDTATSGPPLGVAVRHIVVQRPAAGGSRRALDLIQVSNPGTSTRVASDSMAPVWSARLPEGVADATISEGGEVPPTAVQFEGGRVEVAAAFPPGLKQLVLSYVIPEATRTLRVPIDQETGRLDVMVEGTGRGGGGLAPAEPITLEGRSFARFSANRLAAGSTPSLRFGRDGASGDSTWWIAVVVAALVLAGAGLRVWLGGAPAAAAAGADEPTRESLIAAIVSLDERYEGRAAEVNQAEWSEYLRRRAELKARLTERVAHR